jgi:Cu(I)/Ag(I) efflux system membrane fusion protein
MRFPISTLAVVAALSVLAAPALLTPAVAQAEMPMTSPADAPAASALQNPAGTNGRVNAVDPATHTVNLSHGQIQSLGWPAMTMDFKVAPAIRLTGLKPGDTVTFTVAKTPEGTYVIDSLKPAQ